MEIFKLIIRRENQFLMILDFIFEHIPILKQLPDFSSCRVFGTYPGFATINGFHINVNFQAFTSCLIKCWLQFLLSTFTLPSVSFGTNVPCNCNLRLKVVFLFHSFKGPTVNFFVLKPHMHFNFWELINENKNPQNFIFNV